MKEVDDMEMPCLCDCGEWFDLNDGFRDRDSNKVVCGECHKINEAAEERENTIYEIGIELDAGDRSFSSAKQALRANDIDTSRFKTKSALIEYCVKFNKYN